PDTMHSVSLFYGEDISKSWSDLFVSIQTGIPAWELYFKQPVFTYYKGNPERFELFQDAMKEKSRAVINSALSNFDFGQFDSICDVGGGYGQFIQAILQKHQNLSGIVFDQPEAIEKIKQQNPHFENSRCQLVAGDFFISIPGGKDAYLLKSVIHDWDDEMAEKILNKCYQAMRPDSRLFLIEVVLQPGENQSYAHCMDVLMLAITGGKERSLSSMTQLLKNSGFTIVGIHPTSTEFSIIEVKKNESND
ncbi:MAG: methyltransferase, partial [Parachlamydiaceae bacterium]|nr:methyltransferase [Parachlamydiaceae bacterium]